MASIVPLDDEDFSVQTPESCRYLDAPEKKLAKHVLEIHGVGRAMYNI